MTRIYFNLLNMKIRRVNALRITMILPCGTVRETRGNLIKHRKLNYSSLPWFAPHI